MRAVLLLVRSSVRGRLAAFGGLALLVAVGLGAATATLTAAWRTEHAYEAYRRDAEVSELVANLSFITDRTARAVPALPGVRAATSDTLLAASVDAGTPRTPNELELPVQVRYSPDGRYVANDRPVVHQGRMIRSGTEAFVNVEAAEALGVEVGDRLPIAFWPMSEVDDHSLAPDEVIQPIGKTEVTVVGIGIFANEVLADELFPRAQLLLTPDVAGPYDCTPEQPAPDDERPFDELRKQLWPADCAAMYRYYALRLSEGDAGVARVTEALDALVDKENALLPAGIREPSEDDRPEFYLVPAVAGAEQARIARSLAPSVTALRLLGIVAGGATLALAILAALRMVRRTPSAPLVWEQLGATRAQRASALGLPVASAALVGAAGSLLVGWSGSALGPFASARLLEPRPTFVLAPTVVAPVDAGFLVVLTGAVAALAYTAARVTTVPGVAREGALPTAAARTGNVPFALGVRAATRGTVAVALLGAATTAVLVVVGAVVFGTNVTSVVSTPERFGWPYDAALLFGSGYGGANQSAIAKALDRPEVASWGVAAIGTASVDGESVPYVVDLAGVGRLPVAVVEGTRPVGPDQVALGAGTAKSLGVAVGGTVTFKVGEIERAGTVSGLVVLPPVGPLLSDRAELGIGVLAPADFADAMFAAEVSAEGEGPEAEGGFLGVDLRPGVDASRFVAELGDLRSLDVFGNAPVVHVAPVRPAQMADVAALRTAPVLLASLVGAAMAVGLALAVGLAVRNRRTELALLRALGATGPQLRATLRWQSLVIIGTGIVVGLPLGIALGRLTWQGFARDLGIPPLPAVSPLWTAAIVLAALAIALVASIVPGRLATRVAPTTILRRD